MSNIGNNAGSGASFDSPKDNDPNNNNKGQVLEARYVFQAFSNNINKNGPGSGDLEMSFVNLDISESQSFGTSISNHC